MSRFNAMLRLRAWKALKGIDGYDNDALEGLTSVYYEGRHLEVVLQLGCDVQLKHIKQACFVAHSNASGIRPRFAAQWRLGSKCPCGVSSSFKFLASSKRILNP